MRLQYRCWWHVGHLRHDCLRSPADRVPFNILGFISERFSPHSVLTPEETAPIEGHWVGVISLLRVAVRDDVVVGNVVPGLQVVDETMHGVELRLGIILATGMVHLDADAVVVVDARQRFEDVDMNGCQIRVARLVDGAVPFHHILSAGMAATAGTPALDHAYGANRHSGFGRVHDDVLDFFAAPEYATTHRVILDCAGANQHARRVLIGGSVSEGAHDFRSLFVRQWTLVEVRSLHQK